jgi:hypothetical protein
MAQRDGPRFEIHTEVLMGGHGQGKHASRGAPGHGSALSVAMLKPLWRMYRGPEHSRRCSGMGCD